jgi:hypothetical protein
VSPFSDLLTAIFVDAEPTLLYRGSRDGFTPLDFHTICDGETDTLTVIKTGTGWIFGGFADLAWASSGDQVNSIFAYMYTFTNSAGVPQRLGVAGGPPAAVNALFHNANNGPSFGTTDLRIVDTPGGIMGSVLLNTFGYPQLNGANQMGVDGGVYVVGGTDGTFTIDEIEVFKLVFNN